MPHSDPTCDTHPPMNPAASALNERVGSDPALVEGAYRDALIHNGAYARFVARAGWAAGDGFAALPLTDKGSVFAGPDGPWLPDGPLAPGSEVFTSSGLGGRFSIGVSAPADQGAVRELARALMVGVGPTPLVLSCLAQGIAVPSVGAVSGAAGTNIAGALALIGACAQRQGGLVLAAEPLLAKELLERLAATDEGGTYPILLLCGGEWPSEGLRRYLCGLFGGSLAVVFSYGAAELGLGAMFEDDDLAQVRAGAYANAHLRRALTGRDAGPTPALYRWDPTRLHMEATAAGELVVTTLTERPVRLVRYNLADRVELLSGAQFARRVGAGADLADAGPVCLHYGRAGAGAADPGVEVIKDWVFATDERARALSGRFVIAEAGGRVEFQAASQMSAGVGDEAIRADARRDLGVEHVCVWSHELYPHHVGGHERKTTYLAGGCV